MRLKGFFIWTALWAVGALAQQPPGGASPLVAQQSGGLEIVVLAGEGAQNNIRTKSATPPVVEVRDESGKPVVGAEVVFQLPVSGASGVFSQWLRTQTVRTDEKGQATVTNYAPNDEEGRLNIKVTATSGTKTGSTVISQSNIRGTSGSQATSRKTGWWKIVAVAGAAALAGGIYAGVRNGDSDAPVTTPVSISAGPIAVGGPR